MRHTAQVLALGTALFVLYSGPIAAKDADTAKDAETQTPEVGVSVLSANPVTKPDDNVEVPNLIPGDKSQYKAIKKSTFTKQKTSSSGSGGASSSSGTFGPSSAAATTSSTSTNAATGCATNASTGGAPSDAHGAVGPNHLAVVTNFSVGFYNRNDCSKYSASSTLRDFVSAQGRFNTSNQLLFDPRVFYDRATGRFFVSAASRCLSNQDYQCPDPSVRQDQYQYVAVSQTANPTGAWWVYRTMLSSGANTFCKRAPSSFWDFPVAGRSKGRFFIVGNDFANGTATGAILSYDLSPMLAGKSPNVKCFRTPTGYTTALSANTVPPVNMDSGTSPDVFLSTGIQMTSNVVSSYTLTEGSSSTFDALSPPQPITVPSWTVPPSALQPNGEALETMDGRFTSATLQAGTSLWNIHTISSSASTTPVYARWRFYQFSTATTLTGYVDATGSGNLFNASVDVNGTTGFVTATRTDPTVAGDGNAAIVTFQGPLPSAWATSGWAGPNVVATSAYQFATTAGTPSTDCNNNPDGSQACRWGDYSATQLDPNSSASPIGFNTLITGSIANEWATRSTGK